MYIELGHRINDWEELSERLEQYDSHHVYKTTRDYQDLDVGFLGRYPLTELYHLDVPARSFRVHLGVIKSMCKALGWQKVNQNWYNQKFMEAYNPEIYQQDINLKEQARQHIQEELSTQRMGRGRRDRLRVIKELVEVDCLVAGV